MITKIKMNGKYLASCFALCSCFIVFGMVCSNKIDALYLSFMLYASLKFMNI